jgi:hypothetical protein
MSNSKRYFSHPLLTISPTGQKAKFKISFEYSGHRDRSHDSYLNPARGHQDTAKGRRVFCPKFHINSYVKVKRMLTTKS